VFPNSPSMICRCCGTHFSIFEEELKSVLNTKHFECPKCKKEVSGSGILSFFKFYPKLVASEQALSKNGISLIGYGISQIMGISSYKLLKEKLKFKCNNCNQIWESNYDPDTLFYRDQPGIFKCPNCQLIPSPRSTTREFFSSLNQVHDSSVKFTNMQWDLFTPLSKPIPIKQLQFKIYKDKYRI